MIVDDGRNFADDCKVYDVITRSVPPTHAGVVNLYSHEYWLARGRTALLVLVSFLLLRDESSGSPHSAMMFRKPHSGCIRSPG
jgi:hypothetical protein